MDIMTAVWQLATRTGDSVPHVGSEGQVMPRFRCRVYVAGQAALNAGRSRPPAQVVLPRAGVSTPARHERRVEPLELSVAVSCK